MSGNKTHYRNVFKSDHLGVADLEDMIENGSNLIFTIKHVIQGFGVKVAGRKIDANIAHFVEEIKPMVLNAGNSEIVKKFAGILYVDQWKNITVQLYIDPTAKLKGETVGGVRINPHKPVIKEKPILTPDSPKWSGAVDSVKEHNNADIVLGFMRISDEDLDKLYDDAGVQI